MEKKTIAVQLQATQLEKLAQMVTSTGWNQSEIIRQLIDAAFIKPAAVKVEIEAKNGNHG